MQMVKRAFILFMVSWIAIIVLMPKREFYYKLEEELAKHEIILNEEAINEGFFSLNLEKVDIYFKGIKVATVEEAKLATFIVYSSIRLRSLEVDDSLKNLVPSNIDKATAIYSVVSPLNVLVEASGSFGGMAGTVDLRAHKVRLDFNESKNLEMLKPRLRKEEKGWVYETSF
jgi:hypothetical protein